MKLIICMVFFGISLPAVATSIEIIESTAVSAVLSTAEEDTRRGCEAIGAEVLPADPWSDRPFAWRCVVDVLCDRVFLSYEVTVTANRRKSFVIYRAHAPTRVLSEIH